MGPEIAGEGWSVLPGALWFTADGRWQDPSWPRMRDTGRGPDLLTPPRAPGPASELPGTLVGWLRCWVGSKGSWGSPFLAPPPQGVQRQGLSAEGSRPGSRTSNP